MDEPDQYEAAWYRERFRKLYQQVKGCDVRGNRVEADLSDVRAGLQHMASELAELRQNNENTNAKIGELREMLESVASDVADIQSARKAYQDKQKESA